MATASGTIVFDTPTNNASVTSTKPISDLLNALVTAGTLGKTNDTGQVNWANVNANAVSQTLYEIFYLNDSLYATKPIYLKFRYVLNATSAPTQVSIQIGTGTDGAGNLTGASTVMFFRCISGSGTTDPSPRNIYASAGAGYLNIFGGWNLTPGTSSPGGFWLSIERTLSGGGAITGDGVSVCGSFVQGGTGTVQYLDAGGTVRNQPATAVAGAGAASATYGQISGIFNMNNQVSPPVINRGGSQNLDPQYDGSNYLAMPYQGCLTGTLWPNPNMALLFGSTAFVHDTQVSLTMYAAMHNYYVGSYNCPLAMPTFGPTVAFGSSASTALATQLACLLPLLRYE